MKKKRLLTLLALLITAATGAWAGWTGGTYTATTNETLSAINVGSSATLTINSNVTVTVNGGITINSGATLTVKGPGTLVVTGAKGNNGNGGTGVIVGGTGGTGGVAISGNIIVQGGAVVTATGGNGGNGGTGDKGGRGGNGGNAFAGTLTYKDGTVTAYGGSGGSGGWGELELESGSSGSAGKAFADANSVSFQANGYILTSNGSTIGNIGGQQQITIAAPPVAVTGVTLPSTATVTLGDAVALTAAVAPADATDKKVKWTVTAGTDKVKLYKDADCKTEVGTEATDVLTVYAKGLAVGDATVKVESNADATKSVTCAVTAKHGTFAVAMKASVTDGDQWTAKAGQDGQYQAMPLKGVEGGTKPVELKYAGDREVKRVTMRVLPTWKGDLSKLSATDVESDGVTVLVKNGMTLTGTLSENYKITIADGATVTLDGVTINGTNDENYKWAGINCAGTATIVLKDGSENTVKGFHSDYPGIHVPEGSTLTIEGPGTLTASSNGKGAGIGGGKNLGCGNIVIAATVGMVKAIKGSDAPYSIGAGDESTCGTVTIGGTVYYDGSDYQNDGTTYLAQAEIEYPTPPKALSEVTAEDVGKVAGQDGYIYDNVEAATAAGTTASAIIAYVGTAGSVDASSSTYKGLAIALTDANSGSPCKWYTASSGTCVSQTNDIATAITYKNGIASTNTLTSDGHTHAAATAAKNFSTARPSGTSAWFLPSMGQWNLIVQGLATKKTGSTVSTNLTTSTNHTYNASNLNSVITDAGGTGFRSTYYWSSTEYATQRVWFMDFQNGCAVQYYKSYTYYVRSVLAF